MSPKLSTHAPVMTRIQIHSATNTSPLPTNTHGLRKYAAASSPMNRAATKAPSAMSFIQDSPNGI